MLQEHIMPGIAMQYHMIKAAIQSDAGFASHVNLQAHFNKYRKLIN